MIFRCAICDNPLRSGHSDCIADPQDHCYNPNVGQKYAYYRYTRGELWYIARVYESEVRLMVEWPMELSRQPFVSLLLPIDDFSFDPKHPEPLIEKLRCLMSFQ